MSVKRMKLRAFFACLLIIALAVCVSAQRRITVPNDYPTIQRALGEAVDGDTVFVRSGGYKENVIMSDDVVLMGQDKKNTIIDGRGRGPAVTAADGSVITGFTIRNGTTGILCKNARAIIKDNIIKDNKGTGVHALVALPDITNNVIYRNRWTGIFLESTRGTRTSISHNVIMENGYSGIFCAGRTEVLVRNNIMVGNKQYGIFVGPEARRTRIVGNNIHGNRHPFNENADNQAVRQQNISEPPMFQGAGFPLHNYTLAAGSPLRGRGEEGADIGLTADVAPASAPPPPARPVERFDDPPPAAPAADPWAAFDTPPAAPAADPWAAFSAPAADPWAVSTPAAAAVPAAITQTVVLNEHEVNFPSESAELLPASFPVLDRIFSSLAYYTDLRVEIAGHTDNQGAADFNRTLSLNRARAVMNYFVEKGIDRSRLRARGYGMDRPVASNDTPEGRANNRRVEIIPLD